MESKVYITAYSEPEIDKKEIFRYASVKESDEITEALLDRLINECRPRLSYRVCYAEYPMVLEGDRVDLGFGKAVSHSLARCLDGCDGVIVFCATIGAELDRLIKRYSITSPASAVLLQAIGSERVEALCDAFCEDMAESVGADRVLRPRFSPGYGDLSLKVQKDIFSALDPTRRMGVNLNDELFMTPTKSVTAIIGVKRKG